jgi:oligopeptide/dipeptide ABC transporter ATP-binding protein
MNYNGSMSISDTASLLEISYLSIAFPGEQGPAFAINQLSLTMQSGEILGLVGESGCGKSMTSLAVLGLIPSPGHIAYGSIHFRGQKLNDLSNDEMRKLRGAQIALIPQDPLTALNPVHTIGDQIIEVIRLHQHLSMKDAQLRTIELLDQVRIPNAKERLKDYPHQFSGGMRQRVMIAMGLSCKPALLIADEPTTALDVTVQAQILELLRDIRRDNNTGILLITHDLGVVAEMCERVAVMYAGRIVEQAQVRDLFKRTAHPYTRGLLNSLPTGLRKRLEPIEGQPPSIHAMPPGCPFTPRCKERMEICPTEFPQLTPLESGTHSDVAHKVCCYLYPQADQ